MSLDLSEKNRMSDNSRNSTPFAKPMNSNRTNSSGQFNADLVEGLLAAQKEVRPSNLSQMSDEKMLGVLDAPFAFGKSFLEQENYAIEEEQASQETQSKSNNFSSESSSKRGAFLLSATNSDLEDIMANEDEGAKIINKLMDQLSFLEEPATKRFKPSCSKASIPLGDITGDLPYLEKI